MSLPPLLLPRCSQAQRILLLLLSWTTMATRATLAYASGPPADTVLCPLNEYIDDNAETVREFFECPGLEDPPDHRTCCEEKCCPYVEIDSVLKVDIHLAMVISLTVISLCVAAGVLLVVCCFVRSCPMYDTCAGDGWSSDAGGGNKVDSGAGAPYYVPGHVHHLTLNGGRVLEKNNGQHRVVADNVSQDKVKEAEHV